MYEDCIEKFSCNRYPNGCSEECYLTLGCPEINPNDRIVEGPAGKDGLNGKDLEFQWIYTDTEIRLAVRVKGTEQWFYSPSLIGPQGERGKQGKQGERGPQGIRGFKGAPGLDGINGVSPIIKTQENVNGFRVEITDAEGTKELQLKHGISPDVVTSEDEEGFNVEITDSQGIESFKLKHGKSSEIDVEDVSDGHKVIITDKNGTKEILLTDGKDAVSPIISMTKEDGIITIRVEDAEGVKEESVQEGITETVLSNELSNYYKKTETYSKEETDTEISEAVANIEIPNSNDIINLTSSLFYEAIDFHEFLETDALQGICIIGGWVNFYDNGDTGIRTLTDILYGIGNKTRRYIAQWYKANETSFVISFIDSTQLTGIYYHRLTVLPADGYIDVSKITTTKLATEPQIVELATTIGDIESLLKEV